MKSIHLALLERAAENSFQNKDVTLANALYNEVSRVAVDKREAELKQLAKKLKFPAGFESWSGQVSWDKRGGHAGEKVIQRVLDAAKAAGFKVKDTPESDSPDGNYANRGSVLTNKDGYTLTSNKHYGVTAHENSFSLKLQAPKGV